MKKHGRLGRFTLILAGFLASGAVVGASADFQSDALFGQAQAYDVLLRGNKEAVVNARITLTNTEATALDHFNYSVVDGHLSEIAAFEQVTCLSLPVLSSAGGTGVGTTGVGATGVGTAAPATATPGVVQSVKDAAIPACYPSLIEQSLRPKNLTAPQQILYYPAGSVYQKITVTKTGDSIKLALPQPVDTDKSVTIVLAYTVTGYTTSSWGRFNYVFKTLKSDKQANDVSVAVSVDEAYQLAGAAKGAVDYRVPGGAGVNTKLQVGSSLSGSNATSANEYVNNIGSNGILTKHTSFLAARETFSVTGRYATNTWLLDWPWTAAKLLLAAAIVAAAIWWYRRRRKRYVHEQPPAAVARVVPDRTGPTQNRAYTASSRLPVLASFAQSLQERQLSSVWFGWMCGVIALVVLAAMVQAFIFASGIGSDGSSTWDTFVTSMIPFLIGGAAVLGFIIATIGLPLWYGPTPKAAFKVMLHAWIILTAVTAITVLTVDWSQNRNIPKPVPFGSCGGNSSISGPNSINGRICTNVPAD